MWSDVCSAPPAEAPSLELGALGEPGFALWKMFPILVVELMLLPAAHGVLQKTRRLQECGYSLTKTDSPGPGPGFFLRERNSLKKPIGVDLALVF